MIARVLLLLASLCIGLALLEGGLRLALLGSLRNPPPSSGLIQAHPTRGWALVPNAEGLRSDVDYRVRVRINSQGLRDVEHDTEAAPGVRRIVVLGDSFMDAYQVELESSLPRRLEELLSEERVEVVNLGVGGYGTTQESLALEEVGLHFEPDLVVLAFYAGNDVRNNSQLLETALWQGQHLKAFGRPFAHLQGEELSVSVPSFAAARGWISRMREQQRNRGLREGLLSVDLGRSLLGRIAHWLGSEVFAYDPNLVLGVYAQRFDPTSSAQPMTLAEYRHAWEEAWQITQAVILRTRRIAEEHGARFVLLSIPSKFQTDPGYRERVSREFPEMKLDPELPSRRLRRFSEVNGVLLLDLREDLAQKQQAGHPPLYHGFRDRHWNAAGHDFAARRLAAFLREQEILSETR